MQTLLNYQESSTKMAKRESILQCAKQVFITDGIHQVTMKDIAKACQISLRSLYYYYANKEDLAVDVMIYAMHKFGGFFRHEYDKQMTAYDNLKQLLHYLSDEFISEKNLIKYITAFDFYFFKSYPNDRYSAFLKAFQQNDFILKIIEHSQVDRSINYHGQPPMALMASLLQSLLAFAQKIIYREKVMIEEQLPGFGDYSIIIEFLLSSLKAH